MSFNFENDADLTWRKLMMMMNDSFGKSAI